jgi:hypothetical protein
VLLIDLLRKGFADLHRHVHRGLKLAYSKDMVRPPVSHVQGDRLGDPLVLDRHPVIQPDFLSNILVKIKEEKSQYPKVSTQGEKLYYNAGEDSKVVTWSKFLYMCLRVDIMGNLSKISLPITRIFKVREVGSKGFSFCQASLDLSEESLFM